jgi:hypothetical protein
LGNDEGLAQVAEKVGSIFAENGLSIEDMDRAIATGIPINRCWCRSRSVSGGNSCPLLMAIVRLH